jgi:hypothetical protein
MSETERAIGPLIPTFSPFGGEKEKKGRLTFALRADFMAFIGHCHKSTNPFFDILFAVRSKMNHVTVFYALAVSTLG